MEEIPRAAHGEWGWSSHDFPEYTIVSKSPHVHLPESFLDLIFLGFLEASLPRYN